MELLTIFITGLTTGGVSCLAMHGGLLASALANQEGKDTHATGSKLSFANLEPKAVGVFLLAKLTSHTLMGFLLGVLGSSLDLSLEFRLMFQAIAGGFMLVTAMNMLEVHPVFRYAVIQPPAFLRRLVKQGTKTQTYFAPALIGFLTILVPCGVTQSMQLLAISSANPIYGAAIMFVFVLGTSPVFGLIGVGVAKLSDYWQDTFIRLAAVALIFLAGQSINGVLVVTGSPVTIQKIASLILDPAGIRSDSSSAPKVIEGEQEVNLYVVNQGYQPNKLVVKSGVPVKLNLITKDSYSCAVDFVLRDFGIREFLPPTGTTTVSFTPEKPGKHTFACSMGMYTGVLEVI